MTNDRYPRTSIEAFPETTEYACALSGPRPPVAWWRDVDVRVAIFAAVCLAAAVGVMLWG